MMLYRDHSAINMDCSGNTYFQAVPNTPVDRFQITVLNVQLVGVLLPPPQEPQTLHGMMKRSSLVTYGHTRSCPTPAGAEGNNTWNFICISQTPSCFGTLARGHIQIWGTAVAQWLRCLLQIGRSLVRSQLGSLEFFIDIKSFRLHYGPGVDSASNRNGYNEYFLGVKAAGA